MAAAGVASASGLKLVEFFAGVAKTRREARREDVKDTSQAEKSLREELRAENKTLRDRLLESDQSHTEAIDDIRAQVAGLMQGVKQVQAENAALRQANDQLIERIEVLELEKSELIEVNKRFSDQNRTLISANGALSAQVEALMQDINALEEERDRWRVRAGLPAR